MQGRGLASGVQMAVSPEKSLGVQEYSQSLVDRSQDTGLLQDCQLGQGWKACLSMERYVCWIDLGWIWEYDWWPRVVVSDLRPLLCLPLGPRLEGLGLLPVAWVSMTLGGLLADGADGRTKTKQGYNWFYKRMELFLGLYLKPQSEILLPGRGSAFSKGSQSQDPLGFTFFYLEPKAPTKSLLVVDKLSNFCCWEKIPMGDFSFCHLSDVTQHTSF